jgi:hypothetical protein
VDFTAITTIKSQVLADFIEYWTPNVNKEENEERTEKPWKMYYDGAYCDDEASVNVTFRNKDEIRSKAGLQRQNKQCGGV